MKGFVFFKLLETIVSTIYVKGLRTDILSLSIIDYISTKVIPKNRYTNREVNTKQISTKGTNGSPQSLDNRLRGCTTIRSH